MNELKELLISVSDSYFDFVLGVLNYAKHSKGGCKVMIDFIRNNPDALTSDIIEYMLSREDYYDHAERIAGVMSPEEQRA